MRAPPEVSISIPRPGSTQLPAGTVLNVPCYQQARREHKHTNQQTGCLKLYWVHRNPQNTPLDVALPMRGERSYFNRQNTSSYPSHQHLHKPLNKPHPLQTDTRSKKNDYPVACGKENSNTVSQTKWEDREICCRLRNKVKTHKTK